MIKKAFTLVELIVVIILIGIISSIAVFSFREDKLALATYQVLDHIRYTQHLAISQHKFDPKDAVFHAMRDKATDGKGRFFRGWWQIRFRNTGGQIGYSVYSDFDREGNIDFGRDIKNPATNPADGKMLHFHFNCESCSDSVFLTNKYRIANLVFSSGCEAVGFTKVSEDIGAIVFDEKGRPYRGISDTNSMSPYQYVLRNECNITLTHEDGRSSVITIYPETGYAEITKLE